MPDREVECLTKTREKDTIRRERTRALALTAILLASVALSLAPGGVAPPAPSGEGDYTLTSRTIWSYFTETPPSLDDPFDPVWEYPLQVLGLVPGHIALSGGTSLEIRSVYTERDVYFRVLWHDVVKNAMPPTWVYNNGNWTFNSPWVDGLGFYFPITDPEDRFLEDGCMRTCHAFDWENPANQERKFTLTDAETGDLWFWSAGITNPWDFMVDAYVTSTPSGNNVGYYEDPEIDLGLVKNRHLTEYMEYVYLSRPVYMQDPNHEPSEGPFYIVNGEEVLFDQDYYDPDSGESGINPLTHEPWRNGDVVGGYLMDRMPEEGLGQIDARGAYDVQHQEWSLVLRRPLDTGDPVHDVIFDDLTRPYLFGISLFGDIMGGGDTSEPFVEPDEERDGSDRCVMNKVTNTIALRFRPVIQIVGAGSGEPEGWDALVPETLQELIHRSGEIHDAWDWFNASAACDGERIYLHLRHWDPNETGAYSVEVAWLRPGLVSVEETFNLLVWSDLIGHLGVEEGMADLWRWDWNATSIPEGEAWDMRVFDGEAHSDPSGPDDVAVRSWRQDGFRHVVFSRALDTGEGPEDVAFHDMARTYVLRVALTTEERTEWLMSFPMSAGFVPDPSDVVGPAPVASVAAEDGGDSDIHLSWDASTEDDFAQYRVYVEEAPFSSVDRLQAVARISDASVTELHLRGIRPDTTYKVAVVAVDDNRNVQSPVPTAEVRVTDTTPPPAPLPIKAFDGLDSDLLITWEPGDAPDLELYEVYLEEGPFTGEAGLTPVDTLRGLRVGSHLVGGLDAGGTYHVAVVAVDWAGNALRDVASVEGVPTDVTAPPEVRGIDASTPQDPASEGEVLLKWSASSAEDVDRYNVYASLTPIASISQFSPWGTVPTANTSAVLGGLQPGTTYHFAVTAVDRTSHEGPSKSSVSARASIAEPPGTVVGLVATQVGERSVRLSWEPANTTGSPLSHYRVYMSEGPITDVSAEGVELLANVTSAQEPTYLAADLELGTSYYFAVEAVDERGLTSEGALPTTSVTLPVPQEETDSFWEVAGPYISALALVVVVAMLLYAAWSRHRRYGRLLSRRPKWANRSNKEE